VSGSAYTLRAYTPADEDAAIELWRRTWQQHYPQLDFTARLPWWRERWRNELVPAATITVAERGGVLIGFVISKNYDWGLVLADETHEFKVGTTEAVVLLIDQRDPIPAIAKVIDLHGIVIPLENSGPVLDALREGKVLTIVAEEAKISFKLTGTKEAIAALAACVTEYLGSEKVDASPGARIRVTALVH